MFSGGADTRQEMTMGLLDVLNGMQNGPPAGFGAGANARAQPGQRDGWPARRWNGRRAWRRWSWRPPQGWIGRTARRRRGRQRDQRRPRRSPESAAAEG